MKVIKNIIFVAIVFLISIGLLVVGNRYDMYKDAISKIPLTEKEVLRISRDYFENKGYKVYFTNAESVFLNTSHFRVGYLKQNEVDNILNNKSNINKDC